MVLEEKVESLTLPILPSGKQAAGRRKGGLGGQKIRKLWGVGVLSSQRIDMLFLCVTLSYTL